MPIIFPNPLLTYKVGDSGDTTRRLGERIEEEEDLGCTKFCAVIIIYFKCVKEYLCYVFVVCY